MLWFLLCLSAYLIGSIPTGYIVAKRQNRDIRQEGSHNIGASNVSRSLGWFWGAFVLLIDFGKAFVFLWLITPFFTDDIVLGKIIGGACLIIGNIYPLWLNFKGGKGIATGTGVFLVIFPNGLIIALLIFTLVCVTTKYISASSLSAALALLLTRLQTIISNNNYFAQEAMALNFLIFCYVALVFFKHKDNIKRLMKHQEKKIRFKKTS